MTVNLRLLKKPAVLMAALISPILSQPAQALSEEDRAYVNSNYGFCDAKKVAAVWNKNIGEAKAIIGGKILSGLQHLINADIASTNGRVSCSYQETDLSFRDAQKLGVFWGRPTHEAKQKATRMISEMGTKRFRDVMANALRG